MILVVSPDPAAGSIGTAPAARVLAHPLRLDGNGSFAVVDQGGLPQAVQLAVAVCSTFTQERPLAPDFGIVDPVGTGLNAGEIRAAVALGEPDLEVLDVDITGPTDHRQRVAVTVAWAEEED